MQHICNTHNYQLFRSEKEQYSVEELGTCFNFDAKTIEWFKKRPFDPEDPVVIFDFTAAYPHGDGGPNRISFNAVATTIVSYFLHTTYFSKSL
jgi:hypothetical protein